MRSKRLKLLSPSLKHMFSIYESHTGKENILIHERFCSLFKKFQNLNIPFLSNHIILTCVSKYLTFSMEILIY